MLIKKLESPSRSNKNINDSFDFKGGFSPSIRKKAFSVSKREAAHNQSTRKLLAL